MLRAVVRGDELTAEVLGSRATPYSVRIHVEGPGISSVACACPYDQGAWCKHVVAVLLAWVEDPDAVEEREPLETHLDHLDAEVLRHLLLDLARRDPAILEAIEARVGASRPDAGQGDARLAGPPRQLVDPDAYARLTRQALGSLGGMRASQAYYHVGSVVGDVQDLVGEARGFLDAARPLDALAVLEGVTDAYVEDWMVLDGSSGETGEFFWELGLAWAEALFQAGLPATDRVAWKERLEAWTDEVEPYGIDDAFDAALTVVEHGRETLEVLAAEGGADDPSVLLDDGLVERLLDVLVREERVDEHLAVTARLGLHGPHVATLARAGRLDEARAYALAEVHDAGHALESAEALWAAGEREAAMEVAGRAPTMQGTPWDKAEVSRWLSGAALDIGDASTALEAGLAAFRDEPTLEEYQRVRGLAGETWPELERDLVELVRAHETVRAGEQVAILLEAGELDGAIEVADADPFYGVVEPVVDAAIEQAHRLDWAARAAIDQAAPIVEAGDARRYHHAVRWLVKANRAFEAAGKQRDWTTFHDDLRQRHGRKYKLMGLLDEAL